MNVKQETLENDNIVIKQENAFDVPHTKAINDAIDSFKNEQTYSFTTVKVKRDSQRSPGEEMSDFICDVPETQNSEVKAFDLFVTPGDLHLLKQEVTKMEYIVPKAELLTDYCDLPTIKSDEEFWDKPSTSNNSPYPLEQPKLNTFKKKVNCFKYNPSFQKRRDNFDRHFWKRWLACEFCGYFYTRKMEYCLHYLNHFVNIKTRQLLCSKTNTPLLLKKQKHCQTKLYKCNKTKHLIIVDQKSFKCEICSKLFKLKYNLDRHFKTCTDHFKMHTGENLLKCEICLKQFTRQTTLNDHLKIHTGEIPFKCGICFKQYKWRSNFNQHLTIHTGKKFQCGICCKLFLFERNLKRHFKTHSGEKSFQCEKCLKEFTRKDILIKHLKIHTGEKLFKCEVCLKEFTQEATLKYHLDIHTGEKPFVCGICLKQFKRKRNLNKHLKIHSGEKPVKCKICLKQFTQKQNLSEHVKSHINENPFKCKICLKQFTQKQNLNEHLKTHNGEKPFKCKICVKQFKQKHNLNKHLKTHTGD